MHDGLQRDRVVVVVVMKVVMKVMVVQDNTLQFPMRFFTLSVLIPCAE